MPFYQAPFLGLFLSLSAIVLGLISFPGWAAPLDHAFIQKLAHTTTWRQLLRYDESYGGSTIVDKTFFISPRGRIDAEAELQATLNAFALPGALNNEHPRCRFPARYFWLSQQLNRPELAEIPEYCDKLRTWPVLREAKSVSVVYVSGYLGNPASVFGHAFLKINTDKPDELLDQTINYGALIPPKESTLMYVIRGLTGGYVAGFSDRYYYTQDMTYANTEFRDMWDYRLALTDEQLRFLLLRIWELTGKKQKYFFLTRNCAYELGRLLNLVLNTEAVAKPNVWFAPVELFEALARLEQKTGTRSVIKTVTFKPSSERKLYRLYQIMPQHVRKVAISLAQTPVTSWDSLLQSLAVNEQLQALDFALAVSYFRFMKNFPNVEPSVKARHQRVLVKRLQYPATIVHEKRKNVNERVLPPTEQAPPRYAGYGLAFNDDEVTQGFSFSPFAQNSIGLNDLEGDALVVMEAQLTFDKPYLERLDYIRIRKLARRRVPLDEFSAWSWQVRLWTERAESAVGDEFRTSIEGGVGRSVHGDGYSFTMLAGVRGRDDGTVSLFPKIEYLIAPSPHFKLLAEVGYAWHSDHTEGKVLSVSTQYHISRQWSVFAAYEDTEERLGRLEIRHHW